MYAPEFPNNLKWFNTPPLTITELRGKAVLVDFWTYSCVNCIRTLPHLKAWHAKYAKDGLVIVGVHTPEFEFEKNSKNIERAVRDFAIEYPVVSDPDYKIWNLYANHWWPRKFLVSKDGRIVHDHIGEGGYQETEQKIQQELKAISPSFKPSALELDNGGKNMVCLPTTPEYYLGYARGSYGNAEDIHPNTTFLYQDGSAHKPSRAYLKGNWLVADEYVEHAEFSQNFSDYLALNFEAVEINVVGQSRDDDEITAKLLLDGAPLTAAAAGEDVKIENGEAVVTFKTPRMYRLFNSRDFVTGELKITVEKSGLQLFAFTFGGCTPA